MAEESVLNLNRIHLKGKSGTTFTLHVSDVDIQRINAKGSTLASKVFDMLQRGEDVQPLFLDVCVLEAEETVLPDMPGPSTEPASPVKPGPSREPRCTERPPVPPVEKPAAGKPGPSGDNTSVGTPMRTPDTEKYVWTEGSTKRLISLRKDFNSRFDLGRETKKSLWMEISRRFNELEGTTLEWDQLKNKWSKLENKFKETDLHNKKSGNGRKSFAFQDEMEDAMGGNPIITPVCTLSSSADVEEARQEPPKKKKRKSENILDYLKDMREERREREERMMREQREVQNRKCDLMERFLNLYERDISKN